MSYIKQQVLHSRKFNDRQVLITEDGNVEITPNGGTVTINGDLNVSGSAPGPTNDLIYYVSTEGSDANTGLHSGPSAAKRTIKAAVEAAPAGATIQIAPGDYHEENPITLKERQTVRGDSLRNCRIFPNNNTQTIFYVDNACYLFQLTFRGLRDPGWCVEIKPGALVTTSPYVQNCSNINGPWLNDGTEFIPFQTYQLPTIEPGNRPIIDDESIPLEKRVNDTGGGNGMKVDGDQYHPDSLVKSMVADAFTQVAQGGIGFEITNFGYTQIVSCFSVFTRIGFLTTNGGYLSISNSVSDFGTYGLIADGKDPDYYTAGYPTQDFYSSVGSVEMVNTGAGYTQGNPPTVTFDTPAAPGGVQALGTAIVDPNSGEITGVTITEAGSGYDVVPNVTFSGGSPSVNATGDVNLLTNFQIEVEGLVSKPQIGSVIEFEGVDGEFYITDVETTVDPFVYDEQKCRRDQGLIFDAILGDAVFSTDYQSVVAGRSYLRSVSSEVRDRQLLQTLYGIEELKNAMLAQLPSADPSNATIRNIISARILQIKDIIDTGSVPAHTITDLATINNDNINFKDNVILNRDFIVEEITAYISNQFTNLVYDESKCRRDTELILEALYRDALLDTNHNSIVAGLAYRRAMSAYLEQNQLPATILAIRELKRLIAIEMSGNPTAVSRTEDRIDTILEIMEFGTLPSEGQYFNDPTGVDANVSAAAQQLQDNIEFLKAEVVAYVNNTYNNPPGTFVYDQDKCASDAGQIVDAVTHDLLYGGNRSTLIAARAYFDGAASQVAGQQTQTADAIEHLKDVAALVITGDPVTPTVGNSETQSFVGSFGTVAETDTTAELFNIVSTAVVDGLTSTPSNANPDFDWVNEDYFNVVKRLLDNLGVLQDGVIDYISNNIQGFTYDIATCERDVDYIIDALVYDIMYGGNKQTKGAADAYYNNAVIEGQEGVTEFTFKHLATVVENVGSNTLIADPAAGTGATYVQNTGGIAASANISAEARILVEKIAEVIQYGSSVTPVLLEHDYAGLGDPVLLTKRAQLINVKQDVIDTSIDELNFAYGGTSNINIFPGILSVLTSNRGELNNVSTVSTSGHAFEYVGAGITYNALPFFGGVPIEGNEFVELNGGKVFAGGVVDQIGNFRVGNFFRVNALTGAVTINADQIDLQGLSSIGPFRRLGVPVGVEIREASANPNLVSSQGGPDENTVPTQTAVIDYVANRYLGLGGGTLTGDLAINGGDLTSTATTFNLVNDTVTTLNIGSDATDISIGSSTSITDINGDLEVYGDLVVHKADDSTAGRLNSDADEFFLLDDNVKTIHLGGEALEINIGGPTSEVIIENMTAGGDFDIEGELNVDSGILTTTSPTVSIFDTVPTTATMLLNANDITIGSQTGKTNIRTDLDVEGNLVVKGYDSSPAAVIDTTAPSLNIANTPVNLTIGHSANDIVIGATSGLTTIRTNLEVDSDVEINSGIITTSGTGASIFNENALQVDIGGDATTVNIGADTGTLTISNDIVIIDSTEGLKIPVGITAERPANEMGYIRFNSESQNFEGYDGIAWGSLGGVKDVDQDTYISAETSPGADNDDLEFFTAGIRRAILNEGGIRIQSSQGSENFNTGALVVEGGAGIHSDLYVGNNLRVYNTALIEGSTTITGGLTVGTFDSVIDQVTFNSNTTFNVYDDTLATFEVIEGTNSIIKVDVAGGVSTLIFDTPTVEINNTTGSTTSTSGALTIAGGVGIAENLYVGNDLEIEGSNLTTSQTTFDILNTTATTINAFGAATSISIGAATGTITFNNATPIFDSTGAVQIPVGATADRPVAGTGQIRFNTDDSVFEGYDGTNWGSLGGIKDVDQDTYITAESTPAADEDELTFYTAGTSRAVLSQTDFTVDATIATTFNNTTSSTDKDTGAVIIEGGLGVEENLFVGGVIGANAGILNLTDTNTDKIVIAANTIETTEQFKIIADDVNAGSITYPITIAHHNSAGVVSIGSGVGLAFEHESANNNFETVGLIDLESTDVTSTSEDYDMVFKTMSAGTPASEKLRLSAALATLNTSLTINGNLLVEGQLNADSFVGSIFAEDSTLMVDANNNAIFANTLTVTDLTVTNPIPVPSGGTGAATFTTDGILYGNGTDAVQVTDAAGDADVSTSFQLLTVTSDADSTPVWTDTIDGGSFGGADGGGGVTSDPDGTLVVGTRIRFDDFSIVNASETILSTVSETEIDSFPLADFRSSKATIQITDTVTGEYQISEVMVLHNGVDAFITTFGTIFTGSAPLATFDADILNADVRILATGASSNQTTYKIQRTSITV